MESNRRKSAESKVDITTIKEADEIQKAIDKEKRRKRKKEERREELMDMPSYRAMNGIEKVCDKYFLDPLIGFIPGGIGDLFNTVLGLPFIWFSIVHVKSLPLTLAVIHNILIDILLGLIPFIGNFLDIFHRAYRKNMKLIVGYVNDDKEIISQVRSKAVFIAIMIAALCGLIYLLVKVVISGVSSVTDWIGGLF